MYWYITLFILYFGAMFGIACYYFYKIKTYEDYMISSWSTGFWKITGTIISTNAGAAVFDYFALISPPFHRVGS
ncbi:hypothetical protein [Jeotgalicoccus sp. ATCC 8456]|uniref:hypothetical protein n=1 Tax=Jeotgalicoccus sp. ATCC 8456 TaxID=946435 RepID=UPI001F34FA81|nr:hypothetical protein [Jeotgalicoccus sp. ATCC 8456]